MNLRPFLIAFEGIDGSGKGTQAMKLREWLEVQTKKSVGGWTEPNDESSLIAKTIRAVLAKEIKIADPFEFQRMYVIDRAQNIFSHLVQNKDNHEYKVTERFALSTIAYGMLTGRPAEDFINLHREVLGPSMVWPDLTILIDVQADTAISRINSRRDMEGRAKESFEKKNFLEKVRENYLSLAKRNDIGKITVVNGERPQEEVFEDVKKAVSKHFGF
ncbi:dTMP kinase [Candidatus Giovannonibacteria bacterium]|nr:dTMP kinase [Candidatus Giovannonibacteria bacterium]